ncbi:Glycosyl transferase family 2 [Gimesia alba]|uniref:Glycosyl transferase family 2 n=1 Tax=Gimesia alba TaxID=2527973 RepID=A0A517RJJ1_9PLAN|nr:glycosyltransferase family A protein [Gimesia alba]QDT44047.1 Glycosyl transferase family 2 [Gimesia alba]
MKAVCLTIEIRFPEVSHPEKSKKPQDHASTSDLTGSIRQVLNEVSCITDTHEARTAVYEHGSDQLLSKLRELISQDRLQENQYQLQLKLNGQHLIRYEYLVELLEQTGCQLDIYLQNDLPDFQRKYNQAKKLIERWKRSYDLKASVQTHAHLPNRHCIENRLFIKLSSKQNEIADDLQTAETLRFQFQNGTLLKADQTLSFQPVKRDLNRDQGPSTEYDIDVFVPYFRNLHLVPQTIDSILWQHKVRPFIHLVNDCSREDDTALKQRYGHLTNIKWYKTKQNSGPYAIANNLFYHMQTDLIGIADSDDILEPTHFMTALHDLKENNADVWGSSMRQFLNPMENHNQRNQNIINRIPVVDSGARPDCIPYPRLINGTMVIKRSTFQSFNGFDGRMFCGADTEFSQRLQFPSDINAKIHVSTDITAFRRVCSNSLSNSDTRFGLKSPERDAVTKESLRRYAFWKSQDKIDPTEYGTLDVQPDVFEPDYSIIFRRSSPVYICMAAIPRRIYALEKTIESLIDQADYLKIYLNQFQHVPDFLKHDKIELIFGDNSRKGSTKFFWADKVQGYILTVDDDLIYPSDYVEVMCSAIDKHKCLVGAHGNILKPGKIDRYYKDRTVLDARKEVKEDTFVDILGTGTIGFHTDDIKMSMADMDLPDMEDIAIFKLSYNHSYTKVVVAHPEGWFQSSTHQNDLGLYGDAVLDDSLETEVINAHKNHR